MPYYEAYYKPPKGEEHLRSPFGDFLLWTERYAASRTIKTGGRYGWATEVSTHFCIRLDRDPHRFVLMLGRDRDGNRIEVWHNVTPHEVQNWRMNWRTEVARILLSMRRQLQGTKS